MRVFLSWSGDTARQVAQRLHDFIPSVIQQVEPFLSDNMDRGVPWFERIGRALEETDFGIVCVTPASRHAPWLLFEAGALSKRVSQARVIPFAIGMRKVDLDHPLGLFNAADTSREDVLRTVKTINNAVQDKPLPEARLEAGFDKWWPDLARDLEAIEQSATREGPGKEGAAKRSIDEMMEEALGILRTLSAHDYLARRSIGTGSVFEGFAPRVLVGPASVTDEDARLRELGRLLMRTISNPGDPDGQALGDWLKRTLRGKPKAPE